MGHDDLPLLDEHSVAVAAAPDAVWDAIVRWLGAAFSGPLTRSVTRVLGTDPTGRSGWARPGTGTAVPGFRIVAAHRPDLLIVAGRHRFARYAIVFRVDPSETGARCRAESRAEFPGLPGRLYRLAVIGSGGHVVAVRHLLRSIRRTAEGPRGQNPQ